MSNGRPWTDQDVEYLKINCLNISDGDMAAHLNRNIRSIRVKISRLKLRSIKDLSIGSRFGRLTVIHKSLKKGKGGQSYYSCICDCGTVKDVSRNSLLTKSIVSCGCLRQEKLIESLRLDSGECSFNTLYRILTYNASSRKLDFEISKEYHRVLIEQDCYYCGAAPSLYNSYVNKEGEQYFNKHKTLTKDTINRAWILVNGVDRKNNNIGYTVLNCVPACWPCNEMKMDRPEEDFVAHVCKIIAYQESKKVRK